MANIQLEQCVKCMMFSHSFSGICSSFIHDNCVLVRSLMKKISALQVHIQTLVRVSKSESSIVSVG